MPAASCSNVVFPAPFGPTRPMTLFAGSARSQSRSALNDPNCLPRPCASTAYIGELLVESGLEGQGEERDDAVAVEPGSDRVLDPSVDGASQGTAHGALERGRRVRRDEGARPGTAVHEAFVLELTVRLEHRVRIDRQLRDDLARRRETVTGAQHPVPHRVPDLVDELSVGRDAGRRIEVEGDGGYFTTPIVE